MKEILKQIRRININTKKLVDGLIAGNYRSVFRGNGLEFHDIREYIPGDDIRFIDWKVTARYNKPFVREFIEDRNLFVYFLFDVSASNEFGDKISKRRKSIEILASIMFSAIKNNDNVGLILFTNKIEKFISPKKGKKHALKILDILLRYQPLNKQTNLENTLRETYNIIKRRSIIFIFSDFFDNSNYIKSMKILKKKHDLIALRIYSNNEINLPNIGFIELEDEETGEQILVDTSNFEFIEEYNKVINEFIMNLNLNLKKAKVDLINIELNQNYAKILNNYFKTKKKQLIR